MQTRSCSSRKNTQSLIDYINALTDLIATLYRETARFTVLFSVICAFSSTLEKGSACRKKMVKVAACFIIFDKGHVRPLKRLQKLLRSKNSL